MSETNHTENKKFYSVSVWLSMAAAILLIAGVWMFANARPTLLRMQIREAAFSSEYDLAFTRLETLAAVEPDEVYEAALTAAQIADYHGDWETAEEFLDTYLGNEQSNANQAHTEKAELLKKQFAYHRAMELYEQGSFAKASSAAAAIGDYEPAKKLYQLSYQALLASQPTPEPTQAPTPNPTSTPTPQKDSNDASLENKATATPVPTSEPQKEALADGRIAVGYHHSVFVRDDGTVLAYGDNSFGQTDVGDWKNVVSVAAGAYHTVGLTADGRLLAAGDNTHGQTDLSLFANVKQIAASAWNTSVLLGSGQVMTAGYLPYEFAAEQFPAEKIAAGSYGLIIRSQGKNIASHVGLTIDDCCETLSISRGYSMGIDTQGKVYSSFNAIPAWENVIRISAGENAAIALTEDGTVLSHVFDSHLKCTFDFGQPVLGLCAGANHYAYVLADGTIEIRYADGTVLIPDEKLW